MAEWYEDLADAKVISNGGTPRPSAAKPKRTRTLGKYLKDVGRAIAQGVTFATADEIEAFVESLATGTPYNQAVKQIRREIQEFREDEPFAAYPAEIVPGIITPMGLAGLAGKGLVKGAQILNKPAADLASQVATRIGQKLPSSLKGPVAKGTGMGAAYGAGAGEGVEGRLTGAALSGATGGLLTAAAPRVGEQAKRLLSKGVPLTVGQRFTGPIGGTVRGIEEVAQKLPIIGPSIEAARMRGIEAFDVAAFDEALKPLQKIGFEGMPKGKFGLTKITPLEAYNKTDNAIRTAYGNVIDKIEMPAGDKFISDLAGFVQAQKGAGLIDARATQLESIISDKILNKVKDNTLSKSDFKKASSDIKKLARKAYEGNPDFDTQMFGDALYDLNSVLLNSLKEVNPKAVKELAAIDRSYSRFKPLERMVAKKDISESGAFMPSSLLSEVRRGASERALAKRAVPLQQLARLGQDVLPSKLPSSGTAERLMTQAAIGEAVTQGVSPQLAGTAALIAGGGLGAYSPIGQAALSRSIRGAGRTLEAPATAGLLAQNLPSPISSAQARSLEDMVAGGNIVGYESGVDRQGNPFTFAKMSDGRAVRVR